MVLLLPRWEKKLEDEEEQKIPSLPRYARHLSAMAAVKSGGIFREYKERLISRGKSAKTTLCAVMRKLAGIIYVILKTSTPFSEKIYSQISSQLQI